MANKEFQVRHGLAVNNNVLVANTVTGNVSIGSNTASYKLDVAGTVRANRLRTWNSASNADWDAFEILSIGASSILKSYGDDTGLILRSEAGNIILADDRGNVGIGTSSPQAALDVYNASRFALRLTGPVSNGPIFDLYRQNTRTAFIETDSSNNFLLAAVQQGPSLSLRTNGGAGPVDRLVITTDGNVGIGTSAPANKLDVRGTLGVGQSSNSALNIFTVTSSIVGADNHRTIFAGASQGTNDEVIFNLSRGGGAYGSFDVKFGGVSRFFIPGENLTGDASINLPTNSNFIFKNNNTERMRFDANGNLGIGTTTPSAKLHVAGDAIFTGNVTISGNTSYMNTQTLLIGDNLITLNADIPSNTPGTENAGIEVNRGSLGNASFIWDETSDRWDVRANNSNLVSIFSTGRVGIGTTAPSDSLHIVGVQTIVQSSVAAYSLWKDATPTKAWQYILTGNDSAFRHYDGSSWFERMRIDASGNVGIGVTDTGGWRLRVHSNTSSSLLLQNNVGSGNRISFSDQVWGSEIEGINGNLKFKTGGTVDRMIIEYTGNIGVGTTPGDFGTIRNFEIANTSGSQVRVRGTNVDMHMQANDVAGVGILGNRSNHALMLKTNDAERMRVDASGNVGIGVTSVTAKFVSSGTARIGTLTTDYAGDVQLSADYVRIWNPSNAPAGQIRFGINQETTIRGQALVGLMFDADGTERMRIANTGNVGIGTTSPTYKLDVSAAVANGVRFDGARPITFNSNGLGEIRIKASAGGWSTGYLFSGSAGTDLGGFGAYGGNDSLSYYWIGSAHNTPTAVFTSGGNVGIGTSNPLAPLHINSDTVGTNNFVRFTVNDTQGRYGLIQGNTSSGFRMSAISTDLKFLSERRIIYSSSSIQGGAHIFDLAAGPSTTGMTYSANGVFTNFMQLQGGYEPTANWGAFNLVYASGTINQTGSANGNYTGIYVDITETSAKGPSNRLIDLRTGGTSRFFVSNTGFTYAADNVAIGQTSAPERLTVFRDTDNSAEIGKAHVGFVGYASYAGFSHINMNGVGNYALLQGPSGETFLNSASGQAIYFRQNNTDRMILDYLGNLGIGTTGPNTLLHIYKGNTAAHQNFIKIEMPAWAGSAGYNKNIVWHDGGGDVAGIGAYFDGTSVNFSFHSMYNGGLKTAANSVMNIMGTGRVGIGTTTPGSKFVIANGTDGMSFHPAGNIISLGFNRNAADGAIYNAANSAWQFTARDSYFALEGYNGVNTFATASSSIFTVAKSNAFVGIGTTSPSQRLTVAGGQILVGPTDNGNSYINFYSTSYRVGASSGLEIQTASGDVVRFLRGATETVRIDGSGNMGIGTTSPASTFHVNSSAAGGGAIFSSQGFNYATVSQIISSADAVFGGGVIASNVGGELTKIVANDVHYFKAQITDGLTFHTGITGAAGTAVPRTTNERMRINANGNVGIGTTAPGARLEVAALNDATVNYPLIIRNQASTGAGAGSGTGVQFISHSGIDAGKIYAVNDVSGSTSMVFTNFIGEFMRGNGSSVCIGTTATASAKLRVVAGAGLTALSATGAGNAGLIIDYLGASDNYYDAGTHIFRSTSGTTERMRITSAGNLGIGTTSPQTRLEVSESNANGVGIRVSNPIVSNQYLSLFTMGSSGFGVTGWANSAVVEAVSSGAASGDRALYLSGYNGPIILATDGRNERMRVGNNGYVAVGTTDTTNFGKLCVAGPGTTSPSNNTNLLSSSIFLYDVNGSTTGSTSGIFSKKATGGLASGIGFIRESAGTWGTAIAFYNHPPATTNLDDLTERMRIDSSGNVAIGQASTTHKLEVNGAIKTGTDSSLVGIYTLGSSFRHLGSTNFYLDVNTGGSAGNFYLRNGSSFTTQLSVDASGNVAIGQSSTTYKLQVNGSFAANTKSFVIDHPTKPGMKLRHGSLEGPENGVYVRGKTKEKVIELPEYWRGLVDSSTITVQLTAIGRSQNLYVVDVSNNRVYIDSENYTDVDCYYYIQAERKDVEKLVVEY